MSSLEHTMMMTSPESSDQDLSTPQMVVPGDYGHETTLSSPLSPLWSGDGAAHSPSRDTVTALGVTAAENNAISAHLDGLELPDDMEGLLDSISFQTDMGLLGDSLPALEDFDIGFPWSLAVDDEAAGQGTKPATEETQTPVPSKAPAQGEMVTIRPEDREPLQHYLSTMVQFAKIRSSPSDSIYSYIFTNMALTHAPLYEAVLAWAALHLAHVKSSSAADAEVRYQRAADLLYNDLQAVEHIDLTIVTVWILLQYELFAARGTQGFMRLLGYVADVVEGVFRIHHVDYIKDQLGPAGIRVLMWLSAYDGRAAHFGNPCRLLRCLKTHSSIYNMIDCPSRGPVDHAVAPIEFGTAELKACVRLALRLNIFKGSCVYLGQWQDEAVEREAAWSAIRSSLESIRDEIEESKHGKLAFRVAQGSMNEPTATTTLEHNWIQLLATYYYALILFLQNCPGAMADSCDLSTGVPQWPSTMVCAARIIRLSRHGLISRPNSPQGIWPQMLFQAGLDVDDPIYQSWVLSAFAQAEAWGPNLRKTRLLLERVIEARREGSRAVDLIALMDDVGGPFII